MRSGLGWTRAPLSLAEPQCGVWIGGSISCLDSDPQHSGLTGVHRPSLLVGAVHVAGRGHGPHEELAPRPLEKPLPPIQRQEPQAQAQPSWAVSHSESAVVQVLETGRTQT